MLTCNDHQDRCHHACLRRWITEKAGANKRLCPQCKAEYRIVRPARHALVARLIAAGDCYDILCDNLSVAAGVTLFIGAVWTSLFTYGFITVAHVCGQPGVRFLHNASMIKLAVALPAIPVSLITARAASRMVTLDIHPPRDDDMIEPRSETETLLDDLEEEAVDHMWARDFDPFQEDDSSADDMFESFTTSSSSSEDYFDSDSEEDLDLALPEAHAATSLSRFLVGGLMLPYIASFTGKVLFSRLRLTRFKRTLLGGE